MAESYESYLKELLRPLGIYDLTPQSISGAELHALGAGFDGVSDRLEVVERETITATAEGEGLDRREALFARKPAAVGPAQRRAAIFALMQIDGDSLTGAAINKTISGCGIRAEANETDVPGHIRITFPDVAGEPANFQQIQKIVLDIIPCHLETEFYFRYLTWAECEARGYTWDVVETAGKTWESFELWV
ncbi:MAG: hypothetical protein RRY97_08190 [Oscillibacter sp.]